MEGYPEITKDNWNGGIQIETQPNTDGYTEQMCIRDRVYGARAANGVILVTTKKGKLGAPKISYNGTFGITAVSYTHLDVYKRQIMV